MSILRLKNKESGIGMKLLVTSFAILCFSFFNATSAFSACDTSWNGGVGNFSTVAKWSAGVPTGATNACIDSGNVLNSPVTLDVAGQVKNLTVDSDDSLSFTNNTSLTVNGTSISNAGSISLNSLGNVTDLILANASVTLSGGGTLTMGDNAQNRIYGASGAGTEVFTNQETIQGAGQLGLARTVIVNQSLINANASVNHLIVSTTGTGTNNGGTMEASSGSTLELAGTYDNTNGNITALTGGTVLLNGASISNGTLTANGTGVIAPNLTASLTNVTIAGTGSYSLANNSNTTLAGTINNNSSIKLNSLGNITDLILSGNVTLQGTGAVTMGDNAQNRIYGLTNTGSEVLTIKQTIQGAGQLGLARTVIANQSLINANAATNHLVVSTVGTGTNNGGTMEASSGSTLELAGNYDNTNGNITALTGGTVLLDGASISNGTLTANGTGVIAPNTTASLSNVTIAGTGSYSLANNTTTTLAGTINNNSSIMMNSAGNLTDLILSGNVTLQGTGAITMGTNIQNRIYGASGGGTEVLTLKQGIQGAGQIGVARTVLNNQSTINANQTNTLDVSVSGITSANGGIMEATSGGTLQLEGIYNNAGGTIEALGSSKVILNGAVINGGTLTTTGAGVISPASGTPTLNGVTNAGLYSMPNNTATILKGTINNTGTIQMNSVGNLTDLILNGNVTLKGAGAINMGNNLQNRIYGQSGAGTEILTIQQTIQGAGQIGVGITVIANQSLINANAATAHLVVSTSGTGTNNGGTMEASSGSTLELAGTFDNTNGHITALTGGTVLLNGASISNGTLTATGTGVISPNLTASLSNVTIAGTGSYSLANNSNTTLAGTITNTGNIKMNSVGNLTDLILNGNVTLQGTGMLTMGNNAQNRIYGASGAGTEVFTNKSKIQGSGNIGVARTGIVNLGTITANQSTALIIDPGSVGFNNNNGTLAVSKGDTLTITAPANSFLNYSNATNTLTGGTYLVTGTIQFDNANIVTNAAAITLTGTTSKIVNQSNADALASFATNAAAGKFTLAGGRNFTTAGNFTNNGTLTVGGGSKFDVNGNLTNFAGTTLTGGTYAVTGTLQFNGANIVTNAANLTLSGTKYRILDQTSANGLANLTTNAASGSLTLAGNANLTTAGNFSNAGTVKVSKGSTFTVGANGNYAQSGGKTTVDGTLATAAPGGININGGSVFGSGGTLSGSVTSSGTLNIGDVIKKAGIESIGGAYTQTAAGALDIDIGGTTAGTQFDQLNITGAATLNGTLNLDLINGFIPTLGSTFDIMTFNGLTGTFATVNGTAINGSEHFVVTSDSTDVTLTVMSGPSFASSSLNLNASASQPSPTPEPSSLLLLGSGLVTLAMFAHRRLKAVA